MTFSTDPTGKPKVTTDNGTEINLRPQEIRRDTSQSKKYPTSTPSHKFKLVTVRRLTNITLSELTQELTNSYKTLEAVALRTGKPAPFPVPPATEINVQNAYGVFIDEDLYGISTPVYTFVANSPKVKVFITTTGSNKSDWSVHIAHDLLRETNPDKTFTTHWRIVSIDSDENGKRYEVLEDTALPDCYSYNFDISALNYVGGGTWSGMAVERKDRIPVYALASADNERYIKVGVVMASFGQTQVRSIVAYSMTPTYVFTWQRGKLQLNRRTRNATQTVDIGRLKGEGVLAFTRSHSYNLDIHQRLENKEEDNDISAVVINEFSQGKATYVGNTNAPGVRSQYQSPDFNTDKQRLSIENVEMNTNVIRPTQFEYNYNITQNKIGLVSMSYIPVACANADMSLFLRYNLGNAKGEVLHGSEIKRTPGSRGFQYGDTYKYWWGYGRVIETYPYGDTNRYRRLKAPGFDADGNQLPDRVKIGSMFDLGELKIDVVPNRVITTWDSEPNPPSGFFGFEEGTLKFWVVYVNPPIIGHEGVYYYHINPPKVGTGSGSFEVNDFGGEQRFQQNVLKYMYSQMIGALGGGGLTSFDIGNVTIAGNDKESIVVREPNSTQKAALIERPETFPAGYFDSDLYTFELDNENVGQITDYDSNGNPGASYALN